MKLTENGRKVVIIGGALIVVIAVFAFTYGGRKSNDGEEENPVINLEAPDAENQGLQDSKFDAYADAEGRKRGEIDRYFDSLYNGDEDETQTGSQSAVAGVLADASPDAPSSGGGIRGARNTREAYDMVFGDVDTGESESASAAAERRTREFERRQGSSGGGSSSSGGISYREQRELDSLRSARMYEAIHGKPEEQPEEQKPVEPERIELASASSASGGEVIISSLDDDDDLIDVHEGDRPVRCMFVRDEKVESGQRVMLRLLEPLRLESITVPENTHVSAICTFSERLNLVVNSIEVSGRIYPINYDAYDYDGMKGIYCPQNARQSGRKQAGQEARQLGQQALNGVIPTMGMNVISSGASLVSQSGGKTVININAGYTFYLAKGKK